MTFETPSLPFRISLYLSGSGGGELQTLHGIAHFVSTEKPSMAPTHKHPVKKRELHLKHIQILIMSMTFRGI